MYICERENSRNHKLKRKNDEEHHSDTLSKIYLDKMIAKENKKIDKLRMNARNTTVFLY